MVSIYLYLYANQLRAWKHHNGIPDSWHAKLFIASCGGELFNDVKRSDNFVGNQCGPMRLAALPPGFMFKTSLQLDISSLGLLPCWACQTGQPDSLTPESAAASRVPTTGGWLQPAMIITPHVRSHFRYREIAVTGPDCVVLGKPIPVCRRVSTRLLLFVLPSRLTSSYYYFFSSLVLTFSASRRLCPLALLPRPLPSSLLSFPRRLPVAAPLIPTGVIPPPWRRLNDFILPRLCLLPLMMCLLPSHFDVEIPQSAAVCLCLCVLEAEDEGVMFEQFRKEEEGAKEKEKRGGGEKRVDGEFAQKLRLFMCCQHAFPRDHCSVGLKRPPV